MSDNIPDNLRCASLAQVNELGVRVRKLELAGDRAKTGRDVTIMGLETQVRDLSARVNLADSNLDAVRYLNGELRKQVEALTEERGLLRKQVFGLDLCERTTLENYRKVTKSLNLNGPGAIRKYVRELEDNVQHLLDKVVEFEDARLTEDW